MLLAGSVWFGSTCHAEQSITREVLDDAKLYFTAPLRWNERDWLTFGGALLAVGAAHEYDGQVRTHFDSVRDPVSAAADTHDSRDWAPTAAMIGLKLAYATWLDDRSGYQETRAMLESAAFSAISTTLLKHAAGRRRPDETTRVDDWGHGGGSFPSMHVSVTFAVGTVLAESGNDEYRWVRRALGYGLATATAYSRVHSGAHWLSDTVAAAALGAATGRFAVNRDDERRKRYAFGVTPLDRGAMLTYTLDLH